MPKLVVLTEGLKDRSYELKVERTTVGRLEDNAFQIQEPSVSSHHCEILLRGAEVVVKDLNSTNGTFINNQKVAETVLKTGQTLRLGQVELRLEDGAPVPAPAKKPLEQTRVVGVKLDELGGQTTTFEKGSPFAKKSDRANAIFKWGAIGLGIIIVIILVYAFFLSGGKPSP
jgi:pSer/pThr/pTyr-binding forkhead associated (FHA) protein